MKTTEIIERALLEDIGSGDITLAALGIDSSLRVAKIISKESGVVCGVQIAKQVFHKIDRNLRIKLQKNDGDIIKKGEIVMKIEGAVGSILKAERVALNFLQKLSGIASETYRYSSRLKYAKIFDTRKTTPLLRTLEKYAVKSGGGSNHRYGLFDKILVKENHIASLSSIKAAVKRIRLKYPKESIEIEVSSYYEFREALAEKADIILLDNMTVRQVKDCLKSISAYRPIIEVSGNISLDNFRKYDLIGVDRISVGSITHSAKSLDLSLLIEAA